MNISIKAHLSDDRLSHQDLSALVRTAFIVKGCPWSGGYLGD